MDQLPPEAYLGPGGTMETSGELSRVIAPRNSTEFGRGPRRRGRSSSVRDRLTTFPLSRLLALRPKKTPHLERRLDRAGRRHGRSRPARFKCPVPFTLTVYWCQFASGLEFLPA